MRNTGKTIGRKSHAAQRQLYRAFGRGTFNLKLRPRPVVFWLSFCNMSLPFGPCFTANSSSSIIRPASLRNFASLFEPGKCHVIHKPIHVVPRGRAKMIVFPIPDTLSAPYRTLD